MKRVLVCGGRDFQDIELLERVLNNESTEEPILIIQGGAKGADHHAKVWAKNTGHPYAEVPAPWDFYGKRAGYLRNSWMLELEPDLVIAFPGGKGTEMMCRLASKQGVPVQRYTNERPT